MLGILRRLESWLRRIWSDWAIGVGDTQTLKAEDLVEELLPGILNDITLSLITAKLSWRDIRVLASVSRAWRKSIQSQGVVSHKVENFHVVPNSKYSRISFFLNSNTDSLNTVTLRSWKDKSRYELPPIPDIRKGNLYLCKCVSDQGKIYAFVGPKRLTRNAESTKVYMLDLVGHKSLSWTEITSLPFPSHVPISCVSIVPYPELGIAPCTELGRDDEVIIVIAHWYSKDLNRYGSNLYYSKVIDDGNKDIVWENVTYYPPNANLYDHWVHWGKTSFKSTVQL